MTEEEVNKLTELKDLALSHIKKLGHKPGEWEPAKARGVKALETTCIACDKIIRCQSTLKVVARKVVDGYEIVAGDFVIAEVVGQDLQKMIGHEKNYCDRFMNLI